MKLKIVSSVFTQTSFSGSIGIFSYFKLSNNVFASGLNPLKKLIAFNDFESVSMLLIAFNCLFPWSSIALKCCSFLLSKFLVPSKVLLFRLFLLFPYQKIYLMENTQLLLIQQYLDLTVLGSISSPVRYSHLSKLLEDYADILDAFLSK